MATSEVKRVIEPTKPTFEEGTLVISSLGKIVLVTQSYTLNKGSFCGVSISPLRVGEYSDSWAKSSFKPFKGSVTLIEA